ncbi:MAG: DUF3427 domain-containing protein [Succinivibrio sp.]
MIKYNKATNTLPIFITFQKNENIRQNTKYEDNFLSLPKIFSKTPKILL